MGEDGGRQEGDDEVEAVTVTTKKSNKEYVHFGIYEVFGQFISPY